MQILFVSMRREALQRPKDSAVVVVWLACSCWLVLREGHLASAIGNREAIRFPLIFLTRSLDQIKNSIIKVVGWVGEALAERIKSFLYSYFSEAHTTL